MDCAHKNAANGMCADCGAKVPKPKGSPPKIPTRHVGHLPSDAKRLTDSLREGALQRGESAAGAAASRARWMAWEQKHGVKPHIGMSVTHPDHADPGTILHHPQSDHTGAIPHGGKATVRWGDTGGTGEHPVSALSPAASINKEALANHQESVKNMASARAAHKAKGDAAAASHVAARRAAITGKGADGAKAKKRTPQNLDHAQTRLVTGYLPNGSKVHHDWGHGRPHTSNPDDNRFGTAKGVTHVTLPDGSEHTPHEVIKHVQGKDPKSIPNHLLPGAITNAEEDHRSSSAWGDDPHGAREAKARHAALVAEQERRQKMPTAADAAASRKESAWLKGAPGREEKRRKRLAEAKDSLKKASTPEPFSSSKTSNWVARGGGLPPYIQHIAHDLVEKRGKSTSNAIQMAIGIVKNWASGKGNVDANTRAAAAKAVAQWSALKAKAAGKRAAKTAKSLAEAEHLERLIRLEVGAESWAELLEADELAEAAASLVYVHFCD